MIEYHRPYGFEEKIITNGPKCYELEKLFERMYHCHTLTCSSGTMGLLIAFLAAKAHYKALPKEWAMPAFTWPTDLWVLKRAGLRPRFLDIQEKTWIMYGRPTPDKAAFPTLTFGNTEIFVNDFVIYDATHCLGAKLKDKGIATVFSMAATKLVTACEGGIILIPDDDVFLEAVFLRDKIGRMSEIHASIGLKNMKYLTKFRLWKRRVYHYYKDHLEGQFQKRPYLLDHTYNTIGMVSDLVIPPNIEYKRYYEPLIKGIFKNTDYIYEKIKCLPSWYGVDYKLIVDEINEYNSRRGQQLDNLGTSPTYDWFFSGTWDNTS